MHGFVSFHLPNCPICTKQNPFVYRRCSLRLYSAVLCRHWAMFNVGRCNDSWLISSDITFYQLCLTLRQSFILSLGSRRQHWRRQTSLCNEPKLLSWAESPFSCQHASIFFKKFLWKDLIKWCISCITAAKWGDFLFSRSDFGTWFLFCKKYKFLGKITTCENMEELMSIVNCKLIWKVHTKL